jgi:hypothetical protein
VPDFSDPDRRLLVSADMEGYSKRNNILQHRAQAAFKKVMDDATAELGLQRVNWLIQQGGDGELAILPPGTSERLVVTRLVPVVDRLLRLHNEGLASQARVRLRIAIHQGLVHLDGHNGFPSEAVVHVCRLVDAPELKAALRRFPGAGVALIVSDSMYRDVVRHYPDLRPEQFAQVSADLPNKDFSATAWIYVPGENAAAVADAVSRRPDGTAAPAEPQQPSTANGGTQVFRDITTHGSASFGNGNTINNTWSPDDEPDPRR